MTLLIRQRLKGLLGSWLFHGVCFLHRHVVNIFCYICSPFSGEFNEEPVASTTVHWFVYIGKREGGNLGWGQNAKAGMMQWVFGAFVSCWAPKRCDGMICKSSSLERQWLKNILGHWCTLLCIVMRLWSIALETVRCFWASGTTGFVSFICNYVKNSNTDDPDSWILSMVQTLVLY